MSSDENKIDSDYWTEGLTTDSTLDTYDRDEMILCVKCARKNPPTRLDCLYCGVELEMSGAERKTLKPVLKTIAPHEKGVNLIYLANLEEWDNSRLVEVAKMSRFNRDKLRDLVDLRKPLPIARTTSGKEAEMVSLRLKEMGIKTRLISDESFGFNKSAIRLSRINFAGEKISLVSFNDGGITEVLQDDISLIVVGIIFEQRVEATERYSKKSENKILDTSQANADQTIFDIYIKRKSDAFRVSTNGFDFSCLENEKEMLASQNIKALFEKLNRMSRGTKLDDDYLKVRGLLTSVWGLDEHVDSKGIKRKGLNSFNKKSVTTTTNIEQFNKYSRMCWYLNNESEK